MHNTSKWSDSIPGPDHLEIKSPLWFFFPQLHYAAEPKPQTDFVPVNQVLKGILLF